MRHVVFKTPGLIDIRSFTVFGLSSKPNSDSPIGKFGTGLKMAIGVLVRNNIPVVVWIGRTKYTFKRRATKFREGDFDRIVMLKEVHGVRKILQKTEELLPFTTELGKYWELWQAYRELESNTRDEKGRTILVDNGPNRVEPVQWNRDATHIIVSGEKFVQEYLDREKTFLPDGLTQRGESTGDIQILDRPSQHVYWRGIRVHDLPKESPSQLTYNFLCDIELTEDRTAKDTWTLEYKIKQSLARSEDEGVLTKAVHAPEGSFEHTLSYDYISMVPTPTFSRLASLPAASPAARRYATAHIPKPKKVDPWQNFPRPWAAGLVGDNSNNLYDANGKIVLEARSKMIACAILSKVNERDEFYDPNAIPEAPEILY